MGVRLLAVTRSHYGTKYTTEIHENGGTGADDMILGDGSPLISYEPSGSSTFLASHLVPSSATISVLNNSSIIEGLFDEIATSKEGIFTMIIKRNDALLWHGTVLRDQGELIDGINEFWQITAVCGLSLLKTISFKGWYEESGVSDTPHPQSFVDYILYCLGKLANVKQHAGSNPILATYTETKHVVHGSGDPIKRTGIYPYWIGGLTGAFEYPYCDLPVQDILSNWNARFYQKNGIFHMEPYDTVAVMNNNAGSNVRFWSYAKDRSETATQERGGAVAVSVNDADDSNLINGGFSFLPPLREFVIKYENLTIDYNLLKYTFYEDDETNSTGLEDIEFIDDIQGKHLLGRMSFRIPPENPGWTEDHYMRFRIKIKIATTTTPYFLNHSSFIVANNIINIIYDDRLAWVTTEGNNITFYVKAIRLIELIYQPNVTTVFFGFTFMSPEIPSAGVLQLEVGYDGAYTYNQTTKAFVFDSLIPINYKLEESLLYVGTDFNELHDPSVVAKPVSVLIDEDNSFTYERIFNISDRVASSLDSGFRAIFVNDGGTKTILSKTVPKWTKDANKKWSGVNSTGLRFEEVNAVESARLQTLPVRKYNGSIIMKKDFMSYGNTISYRGKVYMCYQVSFDLDNDVCSGTFINVNDDGILPVIPMDPPDRKKVKTRGSADQPLQPTDVGVPNEIGDQFVVKPLFEQYYLNNVDVLDVSTYNLWAPVGVSVYDVNANIDLILNGRKLRYVAAHTGEQDTWTFIDSMDTIKFWRNQTGHGYLREYNHYVFVQPIPQPEEIFLIP